MEQFKQLRTFDWIQHDWQQRFGQDVIVISDISAFMRHISLTIRTRDCHTIGIEDSTNFTKLK